MSRGRFQFSSEDRPKNNFPVGCLSLRESRNFRGAKGDNYHSAATEQKWDCPTPSAQYAAQGRKYKDRGRRLGAPAEGGERASAKDGCVLSCWPRLVSFWDGEKWWLPLLSRSERRHGACFFDRERQSAKMIAVIACHPARLV